MTSTTSPALGRNAIGQIVASAIMDHVAKNLLKTWSPKTHQGITREQALDAARQVFGYVSPGAWSYSTPHPFYGPRNVGRPAPKSAAPKSTARPGRTSKTKSTKGATKSPASSTKGAPRRTSASPRTVARVASKSTAAPKTAAPAA